MRAVAEVFTGEPQLIMECPNCELFNPPTAQGCDCGYDFVTTPQQQPFASVLLKLKCGDRPSLWLWQCC